MKNIPGCGEAHLEYFQKSSLQDRKNLLCSIEDSQRLESTASTQWKGNASDVKRKHNIFRVSQEAQKKEKKWIDGKMWVIKKYNINHSDIDLFTDPSKLCENKSFFMSTWILHKLSLMIF